MCSHDCVCACVSILGKPTNKRLVLRRKALSEDYLPTLGLLKYHGSSSGLIREYIYIYILSFFLDTWDLCIQNWLLLATHRDPDNWCCMHRRASLRTTVLHVPQKPLAFLTGVAIAFFNLCINWSFLTNSFARYALIADCHHVKSRSFNMDSCLLRRVVSLQFLWYC